MENQMGKQIRSVLINGRRREIEVDIPDVTAAELADAEEKKDLKLNTSEEDIEAAKYKATTGPIMKKALTEAGIEFDVKAKKPELYALYIAIPETEADDDL